MASPGNTGPGTLSKPPPDTETYRHGGPVDVQKAVKAYRKQQRQAGVRGQTLRDSIDAYRKQQRDINAENISGQIPPGTEQFVRNPNKFYNQLVKGKGPAFRRLMLLNQAGDVLGYNQDRDRLRGEYGRQFDALGNEAPNQAGSEIEVERDFEETPTFSNWQGYVQRHINPQTGEAMGLTPGEEQTIRGAGRDALYGAQTEAMQGEQSRLAAAGIDPRSGLAADRAIGIRQGTQRGLAGLERNIVDENLQRKQQFEDAAAALGNTEEQRRQFDVSADLRRLGDVESGEMNLAGLAERQRQYDTSYTESQRQARMARQAQAAAARALQPSNFEKASSAFSGLIGGFTGGGGMMGGK